jgi:hypothetical protein
MVGNRWTILFGIVNIVSFSTFALTPSNGATDVAQECTAEDLETGGGDTFTCNTGQPPKTENQEDEVREENETENSEGEDKEKNEGEDEHEEDHAEEDADEVYDYYTRSSCDADDNECLTALETAIWSDGHLSEITDWLKCEEITDEASYVIHKSWDVFRDAYRQVMTKDSNQQQQQEHVTTFREESGYVVPIVVDYTESIGRGIFADADIAKGTLIWTSVNTARFDSGSLYRDFLRTLPPNNACDILHWAYARKIRKREGKPWSKYDYAICVDLDEGSFTNSCDYVEECSMGFKGKDKKRMQGCELGFYALRDVTKGEELRLDYGHFAVTRGWASLGLQEA